MVTTLAVLPDADISDNDVEDTENNDIQSDSELDYDTSSDSDPEEFQITESGDSTNCWSRMRIPRREIPYNGETDLTADCANDLHNALWYFQQYFTNEMLQVITDQTNIYAAQQGAGSFNTTKSEMEVLIGVFMRMGIVGLPRLELYWSNDFSIGLVSKHLSRNRFRELSQYLHFADNTNLVTNRDDPQYDRLYKVRPLLTMFRTQCLQMTAFQCHAVDEQMIPYKGRTGLRQYMPKKPKRWGIKVFSRNGNDGFLHDFFLYEGKPVEVDFSCGKQPGDIVLKLCETLPPGKNHIVYFDNYFNCFPLQQSLEQRQINSVGTLRSDRARNVDLRTEKALKSKGRGSFDCKYNDKAGIAIVKWFDNRAVQLSSNFVSIDPISKVRRYDRKARSYVDVDCPAIVREYNNNMGMVDTFDMLMSFYRNKHRVYKWYRAVFTWVLNAALVNSWLHYRRHCDALQIAQAERHDLLHFTIEVSKALVTTQQKSCPQHLLGDDLHLTKMPNLPHLESV